MNNVIDADYQIIQERTLPVIVSEIKIIEQNVAKTAMEGAIQIGERLQEAKEQVGHGNFDTWCKENLNYNRRTAERFMKIASEYGGENGLISKTTTLSHLSISNALSLLKVPEEDREKFAEEHPVEDMTNKALEEEIRKLKEEKATLEEEVWNVAKDRSEIDGRLSDAEAEVQRLQSELARAEMDSEALEMQEMIDGMTEEIDALKEKLDKANDKAKKVKEDLKKEKDGRQAAIEQAIGNQRQAMEQEIRKEVEVELVDARKHIGELTGQIDQLEKRAANAGDEKKVQFKLLVDQLQQTFRSALDVVSQQTDDEMQNKMSNALRIVVKSFEEVL